MAQFLVAIQHPDDYDPSQGGGAIIRDIAALKQELEGAGVGAKSRAGMPSAG
jgi:hypothetical protein